MSIQGKVALVTGGSTGIGQATVERFAREGARVAFCASHAEPGSEVAAAIQKAGGECLFVQADVTIREQVDALVKRVEDRYGAIDILVNNAGHGKTMVFAESTEDDWRPLVDLNFYGPLRVTRAALGGMIARGAGSIINIASDSGRAGDGNQTIYAGVKGGIIAVTKSLARELVRYNIRVNAVSPGSTNTPRLAKRNELDPARAARMLRLIPMRRLGKPEEVANVILFLASDEASYMTGQVLSVSGGMTMM